jgi:autotransporter-associated beta strand protein
VSIEGAIADADGGSTSSIDNATGAATLLARTGIGAAGAIETTVASISAVNLGTGNIEIVETDGLTVTGLGQTNTANTAGTSTLTSLAGDIALAGASVFGQGGLVSLTAATGAITRVDVGSPFDRDTSIVNAAGQATLTAATGIGMARAIDTTVATLAAINTGAGGAIDITETDGVTVAALRQTDATNIAGTVSLVSRTGDIALTDAAVLAQGGLITLTATSGAITDADGGSAPGIVNATGQATLTAASGIGAADAIDTTVAVLAATNTGASGNIDIAESDRVTVAGLQQTNAANVAGTISLTTATGDIGLTDDSVLAYGGLVTLTARAGAILDADGGSAASIINADGQATLIATAGIGAVRELRTTIATLAATDTGGGGAIRIREADGLTVAHLEQADGTIALTTVGGDLTLDGAVSSGSGETNLAAASGAVNQLGGTIEAGQLSITANNGATFVEYGNDVDTVSAFIFGAGQTFAYRDADDLVVDVTASAPAGAFGIRTDGDVTLIADSGQLTVAAAINAGAGGVTLAAEGIGIIADISTDGGLALVTSGNARVDGTIRGAGGFTQASAGTTTVNGTQAYAGVTAIDSGTLLLRGDITASRATIVHGGGTLAGTGTAGAVTVESGGMLSPGASPGILHTGDLTLAAGAIFAVEIAGIRAGTGYDQLDVHGAVALGGATLDAVLLAGFDPAAASFTLIDNDGNDAVAGTFAGLGEGDTLSIAGHQFTISYQGGDGNDVALTAAPVQPVNHAPSVSAGVTLTPIEADSGPHLIAQAELLAHASDVDGPGLAATDLQIASGLGTLTDNRDGTWSYRSAPGDTSAATFAYQVTDGIASVATTASLDILPQQQLPGPAITSGTPGADSFTAPADAHRFNGLGGTDTVTFDFRLVDATVTYAGNRIIVDSGASHTVLTGIERFVFTDGTVDNDDGDWLVDDLFYYAQNHDVWSAHVDADAHYHASGWKEGRDPNAFFDTWGYLAANPDVQAAGVDPLAHFSRFGWREGRVPSADFDDRVYLSAYPDARAAGVDPLTHFLRTGAGEGRDPLHPIAANGFDFSYYLQHNPDVAAAGVDPLWHFEQFGWKEGRNPNALFDTAGYLAAYQDVQAAGINPLDHYNLFGWQEGRDPSPAFDTTDYLAANPDVAAAHIDPLLHYLMFGMKEGRAVVADGIGG